VSLYLSALPLWVAATILVVIPTAIAMCGPVLIRRKVGLERLTTNNEIAGFKFATVGVIYAVLLAFSVIVVWERFSDAEGAVLQEAGASATLYRLSAGTDPEAIATRAALNNYLRLAVERDWPRMADEKVSDDVTKALDALYASAIRMSGSASRQSAVMEEMFKQLDVLIQARRTRLHLAEGIVPGMLWVVLFCGAILTVGFTFFFGTENLAAQVMMTGILSTIVFMGLLVIVSINHPFTGPVHIDSDPLDRVLQDIGRGT
jgi:Na+/melibiose symporter-like transporter